MMQWLDRFCRYGIFGTKITKTELRLRRSRVLKLQGLDCKFTGLDKLKTKGWIAIYIDNRVFSAKLIELIRIYDLFFIRKTGEPGSQSSGPIAGLRSMVDSRWRKEKSSPELSPQEATATESSPRLEKCVEGNDAKLNRGFGGRCGDIGRPAAEKQIDGGFPSQTRSLEPREMMRNAPKGCGEGGDGVRRLL
jgi:hypothetical protein